MLLYCFIGNPLTCDCETLWLRNWASDERSAIKDEPRCYFPTQLSGNPLRQLRTSRFTCGGRSSDNIIKDACVEIPVKTPVQKHIQTGLISGMYTGCFKFIVIFEKPIFQRLVDQGHEWLTCWYDLVWLPIIHCSNVGTQSIKYNVSNLRTFFHFYAAQLHDFKGVTVRRQKFSSQMRPYQHVNHSCPWV